MKAFTIIKWVLKGDFLKSQIGFCPICQRKTVFLITMPLFWIRNDARCLWCGSSSRHRHLAFCIDKELHKKGISGFEGIKTKKDFQVYITASVGHLVQVFSECSNLTLSEYYDDVPLGTRKNGILCEDLQQLTFAENQFDLIITEDVLEHVHDFKKALQEIYRVLKPGGIHAFTIPWHFQIHTVPLYKWENGNKFPIGEEEFHGDPIRGEIPVHTHFGFDFPAILEELGFSVDVALAKYDEIQKYGVFDCVTFLTKKG